MLRERRATALSKPLPSWLTGGLVIGAYAALLWAEQARPLRRQSQPKLSRDLRNTGLALMSGAVLAVMQQPLAGPLTRLVERRRIGLLKLARLPGWIELPLAVALMDYTLYLWHVWTHKGPLWRFHQAHHVDLDMDASTAVRFHFGEMAASVPYRLLQIAMIGVGPRAFSTWQTFLMACIAFHHSNLELPPWLERLIAPVLVTPRNHGIHHSIVREETDSNWSSGLTLWDRLHSTLRLDIAQDEIIIGVPAWRDPAELRLVDVATMPFGPQRPSWRLPGGERPRRGPHGPSVMQTPPEA
ncbi:MAG: sterol desaturase family protein [Caulobacteraceae bacterium]|nr:sterol desaturase family protein [Caulobacter sp.]